MEAGERWDRVIEPIFESERRVSTRRTPLDDPQFNQRRVLDSTVSTASKRKEVMAGLLRPSRQVVRHAGYQPADLGS